MIINSISENLYQIISKLMSEEDPISKRQIQIDNYLINVSYGWCECLVFDNDIIIDGYVKSTNNSYHTYHGKTFYELLGGKNNNSEFTANPISNDLYKVSDDFIEIHPYNKILLKYNITT